MVHLARLLFFLFFNLVFLYIFGTLTIKVSPLIWNFDEANLPVICSAFDTVSIVLLTYGVVLEKSSALLEIFGIYPEHRSNINTKFDKTSNDLGLLIILCGLFSVVPVQLVKTSNVIINTSGFDRSLFLIALFFLFITCVLFAKYSYKFMMIFKRKKIRI